VEDGAVVHGGIGSCQDGGCAVFRMISLGG
jgi:hypothetical protein